MNRLFELWLKKVLGNCFLSYPKTLVAEMYPYFCRAFPILKTDFCAKNSNASTLSERDPAIFDLMQYDQTLEGIFYYRLERELYLDNQQHIFLNYLAGAMRIRTGMELYYSTDIGPGFWISHGVGIIIGPRNKIGKNFLIHQGVTIGQRNSANDCALIGDNVTLFSGAKIIGNVTIGDNVKIGANSVLLINAEANSTYVGVPAQRTIKLTSL